MAVFLYPSQSLIDRKLFPLTTYSLRFCDQAVDPEQEVLASVTSQIFFPVFINWG